MWNFVTLFTIFLPLSLGQKLGTLEMELADIETLIYDATDFKHKLSDVNNNLFGNLLLCIGEITNSESQNKDWKLFGCDSLHKNNKADFGRVLFSINPEKIATHLFVLDNPTGKSLIVDNNHYDDGIVSGSTLKKYSTKLPHLFKGVEKTVLLFTSFQDKTNIKISTRVTLFCPEKHFGVQCSTYCSDTSTYICDPQTGEKICFKGFYGKECLESQTRLHKIPRDEIHSLHKRSTEVIPQIEYLYETLDNYPFIFPPPPEEENSEIMTFDVTTCGSNSNPCSKVGTQSCVNGEDIGSFTCVCKENYGGEYCGKEVSPCDSSPCYNNGTCYVSESSYACKCKFGFIGENCESEINACTIQESPCSGHGECYISPGSPTFSCACDEGYKGDFCSEVVDYCVENPCENGGECVSHVGYFTCECETGFGGKFCEVFDPCFSEPCINGGECSSENGVYKCSCEMGFTGMNCENRIPDPCIDNPCGENGVCSSNFVYSDKTKQYEAMFECECNIGFKGDYCEKKIPACEIVEQPCPLNATCVSKDNEYECVCPTGYGGENCNEICSSCGYEKEILCEENPCKNDARCLVHADGSQLCICQIGFRGEFCEEQINYCVDSKCNRGTCVPLVGKYRCDCKEGYTGDYCDIDIDECDVQNRVCKFDSICYNLPGSFICECKSGYIGKYCEHNTNECSSDPCKNGAECWPMGNSYYCRCRTGYAGPTCNLVVDPCNDVPTQCQNGGICVLVSLEEQRIRCDCPQGYTGQFCDKVVNNCLVPSPINRDELVQRNDCGSHGVCQSTFTGFTCVCLSGYTGPYCKIEPTVTCKDAECSCHNQDNKSFVPGKYTRCKSDLFPNYGYGRCDDASICLNPPCGYNQTRSLKCKWENKCGITSKQPETQKISGRMRSSNSSCVKIKLSIQRSVLPKGATVEHVCNEIKSLKAYKENSKFFYINCGLRLKTENKSIILDVTFNKGSKTCDMNSFASKVYQEIKEEILDKYLDPVMHDKYRYLQSVLSVEIRNNTETKLAERQTTLKEYKSKTHYIVAIIVVVVVVVVASAIAVFVYRWRRNFHTKNTNYPTITPQSPTLSAHGILMESGSASWCKTPVDGGFIFTFENSAVDRKPFGVDSPGPNRKMIEPNTPVIPVKNNNNVSKDVTKP